MKKIAIDGTKMSGRYRVDCECGMSCQGRAGRATKVRSPALPVAEAVAHMELSHPDEQMDLVFSRMFVDWMMQYWGQMTNKHSKW